VVETSFESRSEPRRWNPTSRVGAIRVLRVALVAQWVLALASLIFFQIEAPKLPEALRDYALDQSVQVATHDEVAIGVFAAVWLAVSFAATVGVFTLRRWARLPYLVAALLGCLLAAMLEPAVTSRWSTAADTAVHLLVGFAICLTYCSAAAAAFAERAD
jgi:hypothetical protein